MTDINNSRRDNGQQPEDDLFQNFSSHHAEDDKPPTNSIALTTMLEPDESGFISTDQLDEVFGNTDTPKPKPNTPKSSGLSAPPRMRLKSNTTTGVNTGQNGTAEPQRIKLKPGGSQSTPVQATSQPTVIPASDSQARPTVRPAVVQESAAQAPSALKIHPDNKSIKIVGSISTENASVGQILQEARVCLELSLTQVEQQTKIKRSFLEAVERDDLKNLPAMCYVSAYIKTLCQLYRIDNETSSALLATLKEKKGDRSVPSEILQSLESEKHINFEEEAKLKKFAMITIAAMLVIACGIGYKVWEPEKTTSYIEEKSQPGTRVTLDQDPSIYFDEKELEKFIPPAELYIRMSSLPLDD